MTEIMREIVFLFSAAMGAIFGMTTCLSAQAREAPDDPLNYFIGGCASGIFLGARSKYQSWQMWLDKNWKFYLFFSGTQQKVSPF